MATEVKQRLADILMKCGSMSKVEAQETIQQMRKNRKLEEEYFG